jgi:hypothetical protein
MYGQQSGQYGDGIQLPLTGQTAPVSETRATATYTGASNAGFILYSKLLGTAGNAITYVITTAADDNLAISVTGNAITIALANTTSSKNTATLVKAAIGAKAEANALVAVVLTGTGAGVVATQAVASLTGGLNGTAGYQGQVIYDTSGNEWKMIWTNGTVYYWTPNGFPAINTEYPAYVEAGTIVFKFQFSGLISASTTKAGQSLGVNPFLKAHKFEEGFISYDSNLKIPLTNNFSSSVNSNGWDLRDITTSPKIFTFGSSAVYQSLPFTVNIYYSR